MLSVTPRNTTELAKKITQPVFLVYLGFPTPVRLSTRGTVTWIAQTWVESLVDIGGIEYGDFGLNIATIRVSPDYRDSILANQISNLEMAVYVLFGEAPFANDDGINIIQGFGAEADLRRDYIDITIVSQNTQASVTPWVHYDHENIQPAGTQVPLRGTTITIERAGN